MTRTFRTVARGGLAALVAGWGAGCADDAAGRGGERVVGSTTPRIVSLSPAISRTIADLGLEERIVGRSQFCTSVAPSVPVAGDLTHVDYERLLRLRPTHVLVQPPAAGLDPHLEELAEREGWTLAQWGALDDRHDIERLILELPAVLFADAPERRRRATRRAREIVAGIARVVDGPADDLWRGRVLLVDSTDPPTVYGRDTYLHDALVAFGSTNATNVRGWRDLSLEDVTRLDPEAIILVKPGSAAGTAPDRVAGTLATLDVAAVRSGRIAVLRHADALLPSSALAEVAAELRSILRTFGEPAR